jgi:membrane-associated phospholipid phosphatase
MDIMNIFIDISTFLREALFFRTMHIFLLLLLLLISVIPFQGCGTLSNGRGWGQDATLTPGWDRIKEAATNAALSPETWIPVATSLALQIDDMDKRISHWASDNNPIFGSQNNAAKWGNYLEDSSVAAYFITTIATPSGDDPTGWLTAKAKGLALGATVSVITSRSTSLMKKLSGRTRPGGGSNTSFPSGHASGTAVFTTLARRNLESTSLSHGSRLFAEIGIVGIAVGTGWSRVEAKAHYPSDVLFGYALGHFFSAFINDAFLGLNNEKAPQLTIEPSRKGVLVGLGWAF